MRGEIVRSEQRRPSGIGLAAREMMRIGIALILLICGISPSPADGAKRVLIVQSLQSDLPVTITIDGSIREAMQSQMPGRLQIDSEFLDTLRYPELGRNETMASFLREKYAKYPVDLLIAVGPQALNFLLQRRASLFADTPIVFTGIREDNEVLRSLPPGVTGLTSYLNPVPTVELALRLQPKARQLVVVTGAGEFDRFWEERAKRTLRPYEDKLQVTYLAALPMAELLRQLGQLAPDTIVLYLTVTRDGAGRDLPRNIAKELSEAATAPIYAVYDSFLGHGIVGGNMNTFESMGNEAGQLAIRILAGERPEAIPPHAAGISANYLDWRQMRRWGLDRTRLPPGSIVQYRDPDAWVRYRWQIIAIGVALVLQGIVIAWLLFERYRRREAELQSRRRLLEVIHLNRTATAGTLSASIAHELAQPLGAILSNAEAAQLLLARSPPDLGKVQEILADIQQDDQRAAEIMRHLRELLKRRTEIELKEFDLNEAIAGALHILAPEARKRGIALSANGVGRPLPVRGDHIHLEQVILNLAANGMDAMVGALSGAREVAIQTALNGRTEVEVAVADSGSGVPQEKLKTIFDPFYTTKQEGTGLGLAIARMIVETYGGRIWAENRAGGGAVFRFTMPLAEPHPA